MQLVISGKAAAAPGDHNYFVLSGDFGIRRQSGEWNNVVGRLNARGYWQHGDSHMLFFHSPRQTFAASITGVLSRNVDVPFQVSLGEDEGLRGYKFKDFVGTNKILLNLEDRIFTPIDNKLIGVAIVPFVDAGGVWGSGVSWDPGLSTGFGIRIGLKKLHANHVRAGRFCMAPDEHHRSWNLHLLCQRPDLQSPLTPALRSNSACTDVEVKRSL